MGTAHLNAVPRAARVFASHALANAVPEALHTIIAANKNSARHACQKGGRCLPHNSDFVPQHCAVRRSRSGAGP
jgi:hypothetical protein